MALTLARGTPRCADEAECRAWAAPTVVAILCVLFPGLAPGANLCRASLRHPAQGELVLDRDDAAWCCSRVTGVHGNGFAG
jgi:hypothetical protein